MRAFTSWGTSALPQCPTFHPTPPVTRLDLSISIVPSHLSSHLALITDCWWLGAHCLRSNLYSSGSKGQGHWLIICSQSIFASSSLASSTKAYSRGQSKARYLQSWPFRCWLFVKDKSFYSYIQYTFNVTMLYLSSRKARCWHSNKISNTIHDDSMHHWLPVTHFAKQYFHIKIWWKFVLL